MDLLEFIRMIIDLVQSISNMVNIVGWAGNAALDLFLHAMWSGVASVLGLWLSYWGAHFFYFVLNPKANLGDGLSFIITRRVAWLCILAQFTVDILGHAYAVFRKGIPVTVENVAKYSARDFHAESWSLSAVICIVLGVYLAIRLIDALRNDNSQERLNSAVRRFSYGIALFASLSAHMWWDGLLSFSM